MNSGFRILEHPADVGIEATGKSMREVFELAAMGLMSLIVEPSGVQGVEQRTIHIHASDRENLLVRWLSEILFLFDGEHFLTTQAAVNDLSETALTAVLVGERLNPDKHRLHKDVKAATYHQLSIKQEADGWTARVFFDI
ncbi:MAG: archease [Ignavibacteriales bacterium]|nr:archease [Ignavibacteriales bacterium]